MCGTQAESKNIPFPPLRDSWSLLPATFTCTRASIGQMRWDSNRPALIHTHALQTFINASDEPTFSQHTDLSGSSLVAAKGTFAKTKDRDMSEAGQVSKQGMRGVVLPTCCKLVSIVDVRHVSIFTSSAPAAASVAQIMTSPRIKRFPVGKRGVVVVAHIIPALRFPGTDWRNEGSVHDYVC